MSGSQRYRAAHKGTGRQTNDTGRRTKGIEGNRREPNVVHIQLWFDKLTESSKNIETTHYMYK